MPSKGHPFRALLAVLAVAAAGTATSAEPPAPVAGIVAPNVRVISPLLVTAGQPDRASLQRLKDEGYAAVISLAPGEADVKPLWTPTSQWAAFIDAQLRAHGIAFEAK